MDSQNPNSNDLQAHLPKDKGGSTNSTQHVDQKFAREERILTKKQFDQVFKQGKKSRHKGFLLLTRENQKGFPRLGVILSRKVGNSVHRNKLRRITREWFRRNKSSFQNVDLVLVFRPLQNKDLPSDLTSILEGVQNQP